ncbi:ABC transporter, ATP-binding protein [Blautia hydrogenotrophica DSM 10507]|uniref:ABC transporter domain-containing protein n=2 Tax=Blautia hydrogenotrophica TaxID=53443 RepID=C0CMJ9_BLAHS|nr:ABC transporter, ATP-binding protein [Blautia hydrogenotrophica DSM 10507]
MNKMLKLENVRKQYPGFLLDCSLEVPEGYITGLIGQNGAGKTTTFKAILDLISVDSGKITVMGKDHQELNQKDREKIGVVLAGSSFYDGLNVRQIASVMEQMYPQFSGGEFLKLCGRFGLPGDKKLREFSTGMSAKLKLLTAISHNPRLLILDEPTAGLDVVARGEILDMLRTYMEDGTRSILISSHISSDLEGLCDDLYMIHGGKVILHEETDVLLNNYALLKVSEAQYRRLERKYLLRVKKESYGYNCLTRHGQFFLENYPDMVVETGSMDNVIMMLVKGEGV